ncbi:MAG TPA: Lpg1974 family pore-forming outer membrane protein [Pirellulales bacterium]|jgi:hypothetical protein|nr:Lpg1974 family pore-forming outer membrane protein [Pirellulales bacterium]
MKFAMRTAMLVIATVALVTMGAARASAQSSGPRASTSRYRPPGQSFSRPAVQHLTAEQVTAPPAQPEVIDAPPVETEGPIEGHEMWADAEDVELPCDSCGPCGNFLRQGLWYGSVDYLLVRPRFSQAVAEVRETTTTDNSVTPSVTNTVSQSAQYPFKYQSSFRASLGYRLLDCGGDIQFTYWRLTGSAQISDGPADTVDGSRVILGQLGNNPGNGQFFNAAASVTANVFDFDFAKFLAFGGPKGDCDACFCPRWDLRWSAGVRGADITRVDNNAVSDPNGNTVSTGAFNARFVGAGPRVGLQGRRYFGQNGMLSLYGRASQALLIGNYNLTLNTNTPGVDSSTVNTQNYNLARLVPVTDIEIGGSWQVAPYAFISAGWFFQCWWDLGQSDPVSGTSFQTLTSSNILGFDGLFVRGEMLF